VKRRLKKSKGNATMINSGEKKGADDLFSLVWVQTWRSRGPNPGRGLSSFWKRRRGVSGGECGERA